MCGICGIVRFSDGFALDRELVERMRDTMVHRGPDDRGSWVSADGRAAFGHRRLSIVDLSPAGRGPMSNEDGTVWITYNGEVYNHAELRRELEAKGHVYRSDTDTETIVHLYEEEGVEALQRLRGMFAIAIWDGRKGDRDGELLLVRDRIGIKPLYYSLQPGGLVFGSEIKALLEHPQVTAEMDREAFADYLTFVSTPAPRTMFAGIRKLAPAEYARVTPDGRMEVRRYWSPLSRSRTDELAGAGDKELQEELLTLLRRSIERRMMADVPFGVLLSGGVDSSTNVALMSELMDRPVSTFSVAFADHERYNELGHARRIAELYGTDHHEVTIDESDLETFLPALIHHQDEPIADWVCVPLYYVAKLAKDNGTTVVQVGEGSDELFHGYSHYVDFAERGYGQVEALRRLPRPLLRGALAVASPLAHRAGRGLAKVELLERAALESYPYWGGAIAWRGEARRKLVGDRMPAHDPEAVIGSLWDEAERELPGIDLKQRMSYLEVKQRLAELLLMRVDKMTMASSVEARVPFLDHDLVEFAFALPERAKVRGGEGKWLLKKAVEGLLPNDVIYRPKQGFGAPVAEWFQGDFGRRSQRQIRESSLAELGLLDLDYVDRLWDSHRSGRGHWSFQLWNLLNVSAWHDVWIAGREIG